MKLYLLNFYYYKYCLLHHFLEGGFFWVGGGEADL